MTPHMMAEWRAGGIYGDPSCAADRAWSEFLDVLTGQAPSSRCPTLDELQISREESMDPTAIELLNLYDGWSESRRALAYAGFLKLAAAYPEKNIQNGGTADLWLTAIADEEAGRSPWL